MLTLGGAIVVRGLEPGDPPQIGPYRLVGRLGGGGMGRVFLGLSAGGRPVAVKVVRAELAADLEFRVRFGREVVAARRVSGLFTALVVDADVDGPVPWLATAYVPGPSLSEAVTRYGPMPARPALALAAGLAEGLSAIHAAGVVHCDLKPANVLLSPDGPRVIDFGISRAAEALPGAGAGLVVGSPGFMSPEQAMGLAIGPASDIFSLGAVLTFAATGEGPFGRGSNPELAYRLVYGPPGLDLLPAELRPLVVRCLDKDPLERPTAGEVLAQVSEAQQAAGWLPDLASGAFAQYLSADPASRNSAPPGDSTPAQPAQPAQPARPLRSSWRRAWRPLVAAGVAAAVLGGSVTVSLMLSGAARHSSAEQAALPEVTTQAPSPAPPATPPLRRPATRPASPRPARVFRSADATPVPDIVPAVDTVTSPAASTTPASAPPTSHPPSPSPTRSPTTSPSPTVSPSRTVSPSPTPPPTTSPAPTPTPPPTPTASPSPSGSSSTAAVPQITSVTTYQQGTLVYFDVSYADPGQDAEGFGFVGVNGADLVEGSFPFSSPGPGIVGPDSIAYPLDLECGTAGQREAEVQAWIYDTAGASSQAVVIDLACTD